MSLINILENFRQNDYNKLFQEFITSKKEDIELFFNNFPVANLELENDKVISYKLVPKTGIEKIKYVFYESKEVRDEVDIDIVEVEVQYVKPIPTGFSIENLYELKFENELLIECKPVSNINNATELELNKETIKFILL
jgi:lysine/ornithine N-monooxygenase